MVSIVFQREVRRACWEEAAGVSKMLVFDWFFKVFRRGQGGCRGVENLSLSTGLRFFVGTEGAGGAQGLEKSEFFIKF